MLVVTTPCGNRIAYCDANWADQTEGEGGVYTLRTERNGSWVASIPNTWSIERETRVLFGGAINCFLSDQDQPKS